MSDSPRYSSRAVVLGGLILLLFTLLAPLVDLGFSFAAQVSAFLVAVSATGLILFGFPSLAARTTTPRLLALGAVAVALGVLAALFARPEVLAEGPQPLSLISLFLSDALRIVAAVTLGLALARYVASPGVALLIAAVATATDLFSVFAGPTKAMVEESAVALDFLLLIFPTFGQPLGFALGISDFIFLALFTSMSRILELRFTATVLGTCAGTLLAMTISLLLERPLPALPFISLAFVLINADLIRNSLLKHR